MAALSRKVILFSSQESIYKILMAIIEENHAAICGHGFLAIAGFASFAAVSFYLGWIASEGMSK